MSELPAKSTAVSGRAIGNSHIPLGLSTCAFLLPTQPEEQSLMQLEAIITKGKDTFIAVGRALLQIRDRRLYRETHATFESYCQARWGFSHVAATRYIAACHQSSESVVF